MAYHPPKMITNNAAPVLSADLAYEVNCKCGCETIILSDNGAFPVVRWAASEWVSTIPGCVDKGNVYKVVCLEQNTNIRYARATNLSERSSLQLESGFQFKIGSEILADFYEFEIVSGTVILYKSCNQS